MGLLSGLPAECPCPCYPAGTAVDLPAQHCPDLLALKELFPEGV